MVGADLRGWIWDVRGFALHDGPGIRTAVFFKGCPLACAWCCNPETQAPGVELVFDTERCLDCRWCVGICPENAIGDGVPGSRQLDRDRCSQCGDCVARCPGGALGLAGREVSVAETLALVARDAGFHVRSGGGLTLTGGEPLWQAAFAAELARRYRSDCFGSSLAVETSGAVRWEAIDAVRPYTDLFLYDIKHVDPREHRRLTGSDNALILDNLRRLAASGTEVVLRVPLVPGCNDSDNHLESVAVLARRTGLAEVHLLPYHRLGERRYVGLGRRYELAGVPALTPARLEQARQLLASAGLVVKVGGDG
jgi:pyruvate formate lyase activating enzyme